MVIIIIAQSHCSTNYINFRFVPWTSEFSPKYWYSVTDIVLLLTFFKVNHLTIIKTQVESATVAINIWHPFFDTWRVFALQATPNPAEIKYQSFASKLLQLETTLLLPNCHFIVPRKLEKTSLQNQIVVGHLLSMKFNLPQAHPPITHQEPLN